MSMKTARTRLSPRSAKCGNARHRPRRATTAGLLAVGFTASVSACAVPNLHRFLADARKQTMAISNDLERLLAHLDSLPASLRAEVTAVVDSAQAATDEARAALAAAGASPDDRAVVELTDAQVALDAAFAQVHHVAQVAATRGDDVAAQLRKLQAHLDRLRGKAELYAFMNG